MPHEPGRATVQLEARARIIAQIRHWQDLLVLVSRRRTTGQPAPRARARLQLYVIRNN
jgi:hypothetical protein